MTTRLGAPVRFLSRESLKSRPSNTAILFDTRTLWAVVCLILCVAKVPAEANWPTWRGPEFNGIEEGCDPPTTWSETDNIRWKVPIPGSGCSSPVIWGRKLFLQAAVPVPGVDGVPADTQNHRLVLLCLDREDGSILWEHTIRTVVPHEKFNPRGSLASASPVTDGQHVWASFGSNGLYCFDLEGTPVWKAELPVTKMNLNNGEGSSPALAGDALIVVSDHEGDSVINAFEKSTGNVLWKKPRDEGSPWATPLPIKTGDGYQVVTSGVKLIRSYKVSNGDLLWWCSGLMPDTIPSPVFADGMVFCMNGYNDPRLLAISLGGTGDLTGSERIVWTLNEATPCVPSPLVYGKRVYLLDDQRPVLSCFDSRSGAPHYKKFRLSGLRTEVLSSPVAAAGRIYILDQKGNAVVLRDGEAPDIAATNHLDDEFASSPAVVADALYLRGKRFLYMIAHNPEG